MEALQSRFMPPHRHHVVISICSALLLGEHLPKETQKGSAAQIEQITEVTFRGRDVGMASVTANRISCQGYRATAWAQADNTVSLAIKI